MVSVRSWWRLCMLDEALSHYIQSAMSYNAQLTWPFIGHYIKAEVCRSIADKSYSNAYRL